MTYPTPPSASHKQVNRAGALIADPKTIPSELDEAQALVNQFRAAHTWPMLTARVALESRADRISDDALVVQRLKRMSSIVKKLQRQTVKNVSTMQDLGGCRAIMPTLDDVNVLRAAYEDLPTRSVFAFRLRNDYIENPKPNGYRGLHFVGTYNSERRPEYSNYKVEIQIRTKSMHSWATAVEIVDIFTNAGLKASAPDVFTTSWDYFFTYASAAMAIDEGAPTPANSPKSKKALRKALRDIDGHSLVSNIESWSHTMETIMRGKSRGKYYLITLNYRQQTVAVDRFANPDSADQAYRSHEQHADSDADTVLVAGQNVDQIKAAYPNYFIDTKRFTEYMKNY